MAQRVNASGPTPAGSASEPMAAKRVVATRHRRCYDAGHKPKFLVALDETEECDRAVYFASRRASRVGALVTLLRVIEPDYRNQAWAGVTEIMRAEEQEKARAILERYRARAREIAGIAAEAVMREGDEAREILRLIEEDVDIAALVLAARTTKEGPGVLVSELARVAGNYPVPIAIVPGNLTDQQLDALS
jgi:nucleotide-binding universal stress UspA family protein